MSRDPLSRYAGAELTYSPVGATRDLVLPAGWDQVRHRARIGAGATTMRAAADALLTFQMHKALGLHPVASAARAADGVTVVCRLAIAWTGVTAPCRVVWAEDGDRRAGFGYGTLPGHPARGEEGFVLDRRDDGSVWFTVVAFTKPARWYSKLGAPVTRALQRRFARRYADTLRRLVGG